MVGADLTHRFSDVEVAPVEVRAKLLQDRRDDVGGGQRAIQAALRAGLGFDHDRLRLETALELAGTLFFVQSVPGSGRLQVGYLLKRGIRGGNSKAARDQEITRIPIGDV